MPAAVPDLPLPDAVSPDFNADTDTDLGPLIPAFLRDVSLADERPAVIETPASQRLFIGLSGLLALLIVWQWIYFT
ncbi:hypothetical protein, partial [Acinetobacter baumannii]|uniref:hypothetical protein n=1 Tax=Acinetobacter baumannii TaxID=470 RepID=UPI0033279B8D